MNKFFSLLLVVLALSFSVSSCKKDSDSDNDVTQSLNRRNKEQGERFLMENRNVEGVHETATGLQYKIDTLGTGAKPTELDTVKVTYKGMLANGTVFTEATSVKLAVDEQIEGMQEGLQLVNDGSVFDLYIPYYMAYGTNSKTVLYKNKMVSISAYSMLHFHVKVEKVLPYKESFE